MEIVKNVLYYCGKIFITGAAFTVAQAAQGVARDHAQGIIADVNRAAEVKLNEQTLKAYKFMQGKR